MRLQRFVVDERRNYRLDKLIQGDDNFGNMVMRTSRSIGQDGAFDLLGRGRAFSESGNISTALQIEGVDADDTRTQVDGIRQIAQWGRGRLFVAPYRAGYPSRWAWARVNSIRTPENVASMPHRRMRVEMNFQVAGARWYSLRDQQFMDYGLVMDAGYAMSGPQVDQVAVTDGSSVTIENRGNAIAMAYIRWDVTGAATALAISRSDRGVLADRLTYSAAVSANDVIIIDARKRSVSADGSIANLTEYGADWLAIPPGVWSLDVALTGGSAAANLSVHIQDTWL